MIKLKILICAPLPPPKGGIATWADELLLANNKSNLANINIFNTANKRDAGVYSIIRKLKDGTYLILSQTLRFIKSLRELDIDLVHLSSSGGFAHFRDLIFCMISKFYGKRVVLQLHYGVNDIEYKWMPFSKLLLKLLKVLCDKILVLDSSFTYKDKVELSFNGIQPSNNINISHKKNEIVFVGWIIKQKGIFDLITAWNQVEDKGDWRLKIIGPAQDEEKKKLIENVNPSNTVYCGELARDQVIENIDNARVFVLPSHTEGFPFAVLEAMERHLAIIVSNVGGMNQLFDKTKKPGWLIKAKDTDNLFEILTEITSSGDELDLYAAEARKLFIEEFTSQKMLESLVSSWSFTCVREK
jgi:glycosyltransferase involved in cell wall biosynthesis